ncbi:MAG: magnesium transporter, partial [Rhizobiales bacterium]|nr:magnesium transporter [Hyphomicrobiales bacterium]
MEDTGDDDRIHQGQAEHSPFEGEDIYAEDGSVRSDFLMHVGAAIADRDLLYLRRHVARLHESEMGDLLEAIQPEQRRQLVSLLGADFDLAALTEVDEAIRLDIVEHLPNEQIAAALGEMDSDDAVYILEDLDQEDQDEILAKLPFTERIRLRRSLDYPESTAGRRMQTEFVAVPPFWTVGQTIDYLREDA